MRYLVTGGAGFIGSHLVDRILAEDLGEVRVVDSLRRGRREFLTQHSSDPRLTLTIADIRDEQAMMSACEGMDIVFHLAAQSNVIGASRDVNYSAGTNVLGTANVLQAALAQGVSRLVFTSSREVYGDPAELPVSEDAAFSPKNLYGASKVSGELYCHTFQRMGLDVRILRLGNVYGPRDVDRVIPIWLAKARLGEDLEVFGGRQVMDFVPVDLVTRALIKASAVPNLPGPVNVASGSRTAIVDLASRILSLTGSRSRINYLPARHEEVVDFVADVRLMQEYLSLQPPEPLSELSAMVEAPSLA